MDTRRPDPEAWNMPPFDSVRRHCGYGTIPRTHLEAMPNLTHLRLENVGAPDPFIGTIQLLALVSLAVIFSSGYQKDAAANYDPLGAFIVPVLQWLEIRGKEFSTQKVEFWAADPGLELVVSVSVKELMMRSGAYDSLRALEISIDTGLTDTMCTDLLQSLHSLRELMVFEGRIGEDGVLTQVFLDIWRSKPLQLEVLRVGHSCGYPHKNGWLLEVNEEESDDGH
ncbi:hypothetical protein C8J57DRAFT_1510210 [Mycena rebaudengoi]|nr:hypothetical protein C8J57DRAFT_1510210 [Mycena rebaudengoi]